MPVVGTATAVVLATVIPWLTRSDEFVPLIGSTTPLIAVAGTNATPCDVNDGSCGAVTAAYETPAVAPNSAAVATIIAGEGRRRSLRMDFLLGVVGRLLTPGRRRAPGNSLRRDRQRVPGALDHDGGDEAERLAPRLLVPREPRVPGHVGHRGDQRLGDDAVVGGLGAVVRVAGAERVQLREDRVEV